MYLFCFSSAFVFIRPSINNNAFYERSSLLLFPKQNNTKMLLTSNKGKLT